MKFELITALMAFAFVSSITPGPNNLMLMASGANFGFRQTIPHMLGVALGFTLMIVLVGVGLVQIFDTFPVTYNVLRVCSITYLLYLAYKIATAAAPQDSQNSKKNKKTPFTFIQAALFQWVNPKAWTMALTAISVYSPTRSVETIVIVALIFGAINLPSVSVWTIMGQKLKAILTNNARLRAFNFTMAFLLIGSLYPVVVGSH
ncbi:MAG: lysine transporter LysE [SAR86 cluster bacterium]|uniref:Lysine transporter LysE n=1 Tax=SAR86 cluster bacterium TaxID=2030880 RepID=A0A2A5B7S8_9GAMM|nr:MAG: lysine transporter LysE [SAR86 cluster bacterium]